MGCCGVHPISATGESSEMICLQCSPPPVKGMEVERSTASLVWALRSTGDRMQANDESDERDSNVHKYIDSDECKSVYEDHLV